MSEGSLRVLRFAIAGMWALISLAEASPALAQKSETAKITIFAAASLKNALDTASAEFTRATGKKAVISYAASSALAKQIEQAAPADVFISADLEWMDYLAQKHLIIDDTRYNLLGNRLVLIAPADSKTKLKIAQGFDLAGSLGDGKLATADVKAVPAGKYAKASLEKLGVWASVESKVAQAENVRSALALVGRGEAAMGIVYQTDATPEPNVRIVDTFPDDTHPPIIYPIAVTSSSASGKTASDFLEFLKSAAARAIFTKEGFVVLI